MQQLHFWYVLPSVPFAALEGDGVLYKPLKLKKLNSGTRWFIRGHVLQLDKLKEWQLCNKPPDCMPPARNKLKGKTNSDYCLDLEFALPYFSLLLKLPWKPMPRLGENIIPKMELSCQIPNFGWFLGRKHQGKL